MAKKKTNITPVAEPYIIPSSNDDLKRFSQTYKVDMMEHVVAAIEFAVSNNLPFIEVFQFKNSDFVITLSEKDYLSNLDNIFNYYMSHEVYEHCSRIVKLQKSLNKIITDEKQHR